MIMTRPLIVLATLLLSLALPVGIAHAGEPWPVDPGVAERPPDLPSWLIASRLGRPLDDTTSRDDGGLSDLGAVLLREVQVHPVSGNVLHADFFEVDLTERLTVSVALHFVGKFPA